MSAFSVDTGRQTTPPLVDGVVHNRLVQPTMTRASVNWSYGRIIRQKIWPKRRKLDGPRRTNTPKIKWPAYTYAEK